MAAKGSKGGKKGVKRVCRTDPVALAEAKCNVGMAKKGLPISVVNDTCKKLVRTKRRGKNGKATKQPVKLCPC